MIPLAKSTFSNEFETKKALAEFIVKANRLSMDVNCAEFEKQFALVQGSTNAILFNSGGSANLALLQALKNMGRLRNGARVGFSAITWSTCVMPIIQMGFVPVPIDCTATTLNVMSSNLEQRLKETHLDAFFITNALGFAGDLEAIRKLCDSAKIFLIEDNREALGSELDQGKTGSFGLASSFSLFVGHHLSTIEGGMVCTSDGELAEMLRITRANGWDRNLTAKQQLKWRTRYSIRSEFEAKYTFYELGFNMRPTEVTGFLGLHQLQFLEANVAAREKNYFHFEEAIKSNESLVCLDRSHMRRLSALSIPVLCKSAEIRERYLARFSGAGIEVRPIIAGNIQRQPFYKKYVKEIYAVPNADKVHDCGFYCGNHPELTESELQTIASCLYN